MEEHPRAGGVPGIQPAGEKPGHDACEKIPGARRGQGREGVGSQGDPFPLGHDRAASLEDHGGVVTVHERSGGGEPIVLDVLRLHSEEPGRLARMRREDPAAPPERFLGEKVEPVGVEDEGTRITDEKPPERVSPGGASKAGPEGKDARRDAGEGGSGRTEKSVRHERRTPSKKTRDVLGAGDDAHEARARAKRRLARKPHGSSVAEVPAGHEDVPPEPLVGVRRTLGDERARILESEDPDRGRDLGEKRIEAEARHLELSHEASGFAQEMAGRGRDERESPARAKSQGPRTTGGGVETRGDVERQNLKISFVEFEKKLRRLAIERSREPDPEEGVGQHRLRPGRPGSEKPGNLRPQDDSPPGPDVAVVGRACGLPRGLPPGEDDRLAPRLEHPAGEDVTVASVVARPGQDEKASDPRPTAAEACARGLPGPLHERLGAEPETTDGVRFETPMDLDAVGPADRRRVGGGMHRLIARKDRSILGGARRRRGHPLSPLSRMRRTSLRKASTTAALALSPTDVRRRLETLAREEGFAAFGIAAPSLPAETARRLGAWLNEGRHGEMAYMARDPERRLDPTHLQPGCLRVLVFAADYPLDAGEAFEVLGDGRRGYIARYALGRDYHRALRSRLRRLAVRLGELVGPDHRFRVLSDSAPLMEKPYAERAGLGWIGKNTCLIDPRGGSSRLLGEILTDAPLPVDDVRSPDRCGRCRACLAVCPTGAITAPYQLDARRCISYLTIEHRGPIPLELRPLLGNRIFGCDDCQLVCPWNRRAKRHPLPDFAPREGLAAPDLAALLDWDEATFLTRTEGSALRRVGHERWLRNTATALGNGPPHPAAREALARRLEHPSPLVREHVRWALDTLARRARSQASSCETPIEPLA
jgi:epoxyqueuosine reductase